MTEPFTNKCVMTFTIGDQTISDSPQRIAACYEALRGLNPEVVPELVKLIERVAEGEFELVCEAQKLLERVKGA